MLGLELLPELDLLRSPISLGFFLLDKIKEEEMVVFQGAGDQLLDGLGPLSLDLVGRAELELGHDVSLVSVQVHVRGLADKIGWISDASAFLFVGSLRLFDLLEVDVTSPTF